MLRILITVLLLLCHTAAADSLLLVNARIFNGVDPDLKPGNVLIEDGVIKTVSRKPIAVPDSVQVIDAGNRVLSPGFIDIHSHLSIQYPLSQERYHPLVKGAYSADAAEFYLDSGFTTLRDAGGASPDLARAIEQGTIRGPRLYPSGAMISQTSGHGDFRLPHDPHPTVTGTSPYLLSKESVLADGVARTLVATRENLRLGATQIKIMGGGGVSSSFDPIHSVQSTPEEIRAAVQAARDWDTYVMAHAYTSAAIRRLVENGVRSIEHGLLIDDATAKLVKKNDVVISTQVHLFSKPPRKGLSENRLRKANMVRAGLENLVRLIKKYDIKTGFGTDLIFGEYKDISKEFRARSRYWKPAEIMRQATSESAEIIRMCGQLNPHGKFGEIRSGWLADLILIDGEPLDDITVLDDAHAMIPLVIMQGVVVKNTL